MLFRLSTAAALASHLLVAICFNAHAAPGCSPFLRGFHMTELPLDSSGVVSVTASAFTSRGAEVPLDSDRDGVPEVAAMLTSGDVVILEGLRAVTSPDSAPKGAAVNKTTVATKITNAAQVLFGDMDGDGASDLVVATAKQISIFFNQSRGNFSAPLSSSVTDITRIVLSDFNGDLKLDIATVDVLGIKSIKGNNSRSALNGWTPSVGLGSSFIFTSPLELRTIYPSTKKIPGLVVGGLADGFLTYSVVVVENISSPTTIRFSASLDRALMLPYTVSSIESVDLTGDTLQDIVAVASESGHLKALKNTGKSFSELGSVRVSGQALPYTHLTSLGDILLDGRTSVLVSAPNENVIRLFSWVQNGFSQTGLLGTRGAITQLATPQDLDRDGDLDVVAIGRNDNRDQLIFLRNDKIVTSCSTSAGGDATGATMD